MPNKLFAINPEYGQWNVIANNTPSLMPSGFEFKRLNAECKFGECKPTCVYIVSNEPNVALFATPFSFAFPVYTEEQVKQYESGCQAKNVNECKISFETQNN